MVFSPWGNFLLGIHLSWFCLLIVSCFLSALFERIFFPVLIIIKQVYLRAMYSLPCCLHLLFPLPKRWTAHTDDPISISLAWTSLLHSCILLLGIFGNTLSTKRTHHLLSLTSSLLLILKALPEFIMPRTMSIQKPTPWTQESFQVSFTLPCIFDWCKLSFIGSLQNVSGLRSSSPPSLQGPQSSLYRLHTRGKWSSREMLASISPRSPIHLSQMQILGDIFIFHKCPWFFESFLWLSPKGPHTHAGLVDGPSFWSQCTLSLSLSQHSAKCGIFFFNEILQTWRKVQKKYNKYPHTTQIGQIFNALISLHFYKRNESW